MKFLIITIPTLLFAYPQNNNDMQYCKIDFYSFCKELDPGVKNMCPKKLEDKMKKVCLISQFKQNEIYRACQNEIINVCQQDDKVDFKLVYNCLSHPKNWKDFRRDCLGVLSEPFQ